MFFVWLLLAVLCLGVGITIAITEKKFAARYFVGFAFYALVALISFI